MSVITTTNKGKVKIKDFEFKKGLTIFDPYDFTPHNSISFDWEQLDFDSNECQGHAEELLELLSEKLKQDFKRFIREKKR